MSKINLFGAVFCLLLALPYAIVSTNFETQPAGTYNAEAWRKDGFKVAWVQTLDKNATVDDAQAHKGEKSLRVTYPKGEFGPGSSGGQAKLMLEPQREYFASYSLRFSDNFSWGGKYEGGKLPGLAGGENCSGGQQCDGTNGFSARFMWREGGKAVLYLYHMDKPSEWGEDHPLKRADGSVVVFPKGKWVKLVQRVKVNTVQNGKANYDGEVQVWYNGEEVLRLSGLRFVNNSNQVDNFFFSTFHGGGSAEWAPSNTCWVWYDDVVVSGKSSDVLD
ncbi:polysaccharide lyase [Pontibacter harenae]|uniref:polysaccharide lyase n=1 Tax=Pontibacter harenae TaxID=2894083 RepID=UPI001E3025DA|nr:hypothetical protein [Pontibacter harenae]MCC9166629.1 hypothetical protein [Pontibacter harenae]